VKVYLLFILISETVTCGVTYLESDDRHESIVFKTKEACEEYFQVARLGRKAPTWSSITGCKIQKEVKKKYPCGKYILK